MASEETGRDDIKVALITGAGTGFGLATALRFIQNGVAVVGTGRRADKLQDLVVQAGDRADLVATLAADITADETPAEAVALAIAKFGRLDYLVNNAGFGSPKPLHESNDRFIDASLDLMLRAPLRLTREALPHLGSGACIINVSSTFGLIGGLRAGTYAVVKAGLIGLTRHLAAQYGSIGIRCNAVAPGVIATGMMIDRLKDETVKRMNYDMTPAEGWGTPEDVAATITFLCSGDARWINGQVIAIDGGWSTTKYMSEQALIAERQDVAPTFTHSGRPLPEA